MAKNLQRNLLQLYKGIYDDARDSRVLQCFDVNDDMAVTYGMTIFMHSL